jgi:cell division transport system permease protein
MLYYRFLYSVRRTLLNIKDYFKVELLTAITVSVTLTILGLYLLIHTNLRALATQWGDQVQVVAYLSKGISEKDQRNVQTQISKMPEIEAVRYRSPDDALTTLKNALGETRGILDGLEENPLPGSFEIKIKKNYYKVTAIQDIAQKIQHEEGVSDVQYGGAWIERFLAMLKIIHLLGISLGILLLFATVAIISNTLKLAFYTRRDEIEIMRLVGGTEFFIRLPFCLEAMIQGGVGASIALGVLWILYRIFLAEFNHYWNMAAGWNRPLFLDPSSMIALVFLGLALGLAGSFFPLVKTSHSL